MPPEAPRSRQTAERTSINARHRHQRKRATLAPRTGAGSRQTDTAPNPSSFNARMEPGRRQQNHNAEQGSDTRLHDRESDRPASPMRSLRLQRFPVSPNHPRRIPRACERVARVSGDRGGKSQETPKTTRQIQLGLKARLNYKEKATSMLTKAGRCATIETEQRT